MLLFFKAVYRDPILRGEKTDTVRAKFSRRPGDVMQACVGPSRIFAALRIVSVDPVGDLPDWRAAQVRECYGELSASMVLVRFELLHETRRSEGHADNRQAVLAFGA